MFSELLFRSRKIKSKLSFQDFTFFLLYIHAFFFLYLLLTRLVWPGLQSAVAGTESVEFSIYQTHLVPDTHTHSFVVQVHRHCIQTQHCRGLLTHCTRNSRGALLHSIHTVVGVRCYDMADGYRCGPCPPGQSGDGRTCVNINACDPNPCFPGVQCSSTSSDPFYRCGPCPQGLTGNGVNCDDVDEVSGFQIVGQVGVITCMVSVLDLDYLRQDSFKIGWVRMRKKLLEVAISSAVLGLIKSVLQD